MSRDSNLDAGEQEKQKHHPITPPGFFFSFEFVLKSSGCLRAEPGRRMP